MNWLLIFFVSVFITTIVGFAIGWFSGMKCQKCVDKEKHFYKDKRAETAEMLMRKGFKSGYFRVCYGQLITSDGANVSKSYPFSEEETKFLADYFGEKREKE